MVCIATLYHADVSIDPTTMIAYALPSDQIVTLKVYNGIGQEVATLVNEFKTSGRLRHGRVCEGCSKRRLLLSLAGRPSHPRRAGREHC